MRTEEDMLKLITDFADGDERIRLLTLEGSRATTDSIGDNFQDYDVSYFVSDLSGFEKDDRWLDYFGSRLIMQKPGAPFEQGLSYLMLFEDGSRIDLFVLPLTEWPNYLAAEAAVKVLLDKDGSLQAAPKTDETLYHTYLPTEAALAEVCNEFWWVSTYVVKGLCLGEYLYAAGHLEQNVRQELLQLLAWQVVFQEGQSLDLGKNYKYLPKYLDQKLTRRLQATYDLSTEAAIWQALLICQDLFLEVSQELAADLDFSFSMSEAEALRRYTQLYYEGGRL